MPTVHQQSVVGKPGPWTVEEVLLLRQLRADPSASAWKRTAQQLGTHRKPNSVRRKYAKLQPTPVIVVRAAGGEQESPAGRASSADSASYSTSIIDGSTAQSTIAAMPVQRHPPLLCVPRAPTPCAPRAPTTLFRAGRAAPAVHIALGAHTGAPPRTPRSPAQRCSCLCAISGAGQACHTAAPRPGHTGPANARSNALPVPRSAPQVRLDVWPPLLPPPRTSPPRTAPPSARVRAACPSPRTRRS